jgi:hypothetical protein
MPVNLACGGKARDYTLKLFEDARRPFPVGRTGDDNNNRL